MGASPHTLKILENMEFTTGYTSKIYVSIVFMLRGTSSLY